MAKLNIVMIIADSLRQDHCGCYGNPWIRTPNIDRLAAMSTRFTRAYPESLPTVPVRRALFTGRRAYPFKDYQPVPWDIVYLPGWQPMEIDRPAIAEVLHQAGYHTGLVTDTMPIFAPGMNFQRGFDQCHYIRGQQQDRWRSAQTVTREEIEQYTVSDDHTETHAGIIAPHIANNRHRKSEEDWLAPQVYREAMRFLDENAAREKPFYLVVDHFDPHEPWDPPRHYVEMYDPGYQGRAAKGIHDRYGKADWLTDAQMKHMRALYAGEVTMCDTWLGKLLDRMEELDLMDRTLLFFVSDHGHSLGEHNLTGKIPYAMYPELMDIPALYHDPEVPGGKTSDGLVYNIDFVSTFMNRVGVQMPEPLEGIDLQATIQGARTGRPHVTSAFKDFVYVRTREHVLIAHFRNTQHQLFDLKDDPTHDRNIANDHRELCQELFAKALKDADGELPLYEPETTWADGTKTARKVQY